MPQPRHQIPGRSSRGREIPWPELRRQATTVFLVLQAGWSALDQRERDEISRLLRKSKGRPRNLSKSEARELGRLAGKAASAARAAAPRRR